MIWRFSDRRDAGRQLAAKLEAYAGRGDVVVLALPRGGVPVGYEVAHALGVPLDVLIVRKLGVPQQPELAMGAIASGGAVFLNEGVLRAAGVGDAALHAVAARERAELERRETLYRGARPALEVRGKTVIVVDDGMATGASMQAAVMALRSRQPARVVVAVPVAPAGAAERMDEVADEFVRVLTEVEFYAVGQFYRDFEQVTDEEVRQWLDEARKEWA
ncbi:MAG: Phosphoribosyl transferase domain protein [Rhodanobacteraceae bacterium]|jgi:putative phosphoribosyl transferase|nr:MAG: Phosphoribosyl transferase domain protein [Rhodanobacteraceae bacterium]